MSTEDNVEPLVSEIRSLAVPEYEKTAAVALLNLIPYAGGAIAAVVGEVAARRRLQKVCEILVSLNERLQSHGADPRKNLTEDQIIELIHETVQTATTTSDQKKLSALKNGLGYSFTSEDSFERKQLFLDILRSCTSIELSLLSQLYTGSDPYLSFDDPPLDPKITTGLSAAVTTVLLYNNVVASYYEPVGNKPDCGIPPLRKLMCTRLGIEEPTILAAAKLLEGKGLANMGPNLDSKECKVVRRHASFPIVTTNIINSTSTSAIRPTPIEASRTEFGKEFMRFCE